MAEAPEAVVAFAPADLAVALAAALQRAGVVVPPERVASFAAALRLVPPRSRSALHAVARTTLVDRRAWLAVFDRVFAAVVDGRLDPADGRGDPTAPPLPAPVPAGAPRRPRSGPGPRREPADGDPAPQVAPAGAARAAQEPPAREAVLAAASAAERLRSTSFDALEAEEVEAVRALVRRLVLVAPPRRTRRTRATHRGAGPLDLRRTVRAALRSGGDPVRLVRRRRRERPRRLVLLCDVSASMQPWTRMFLVLAQGAVTGARAEAFVFSTRLTRLTPALAVRDADAALARAAATAPDWAGGTRLAESLRRFVDDHGRRGTARGAVVLVLSDGWSHEEPALVAAQVVRLRRLAARIVWVNPRKAAPGFAPLVGGMAAALPHCDAFVSGHSLAALEEVAAAVGAPVTHRTGRTPA